MAHPNTDRLIDYWRQRRGAREAPTRASIDPTHFTDLLPQIFIAGVASLGNYPLRLSGGFVTELHGRDLRAENLVTLWSHADRARLQSGIEIARRRAEPFVVEADIHAEGVPTVGLEVLFAPLLGPSGETDRILGLYQPLSMISRLQGRPAQTLAIRAMAPAAGPERPALRLAAIDGRLIA
ncbi:MAG: hypothetical protein JWP35_3154 [Caulobacter sp.]|nr:hypothetical protein [Caulobacter sp.]